MELNSELCLKLSWTSKASSRLGWIHRLIQIHRRTVFGARRSVRRRWAPSASVCILRAHIFVVGLPFVFGLLFFCPVHFCCFCKHRFGIPAHNFYSEIDPGRSCPVAAASPPAAPTTRPSLGSVQADVTRLTRKGGMACVLQDRFTPWVT